MSRVQGMRLDGAGRPACLAALPCRDSAVEEQLAWAAQSDKKATEFLSNVHLRGGQAFSRAGRARLDLAVQAASLRLRGNRPELRSAAGARLAGSPVSGAQVLQGLLVCTQAALAASTPCQLGQLRLPMQAGPAGAPAVSNSCARVTLAAVQALL